MLDYEAIGGRIKKARRIKSMTQAELAELADISNTYVSRIERGVKKASLESLAKISIILNTSLDILVFGSNASVG